MLGDLGHGLNCRGLSGIQAIVLDYINVLDLLENNGFQT